MSSAVACALLICPSVSVRRLSPHVDAQGDEVGMIGVIESVP